MGSLELSINENYGRKIEFKDTVKKIIENKYYERTPDYKRIQELCENKLYNGITNGIKELCENTVNKLKGIYNILAYGGKDGSRKGKEKGGRRRNIKGDSCSGGGPGNGQGGGRGKGKKRK